MVQDAGKSRRKLNFQSLIESLKGNAEKQGQIDRISRLIMSLDRRLICFDGVIKAGLDEADEGLMNRLSARKSDIIARMVKRRQDSSEEEAMGWSDEKAKGSPRECENQVSAFVPIDTMGSVLRRIDTSID